GPPGHARASPVAQQGKQEFSTGLALELALGFSGRMGFVCEQPAPPLRVYATSGAFPVSSPKRQEADHRQRGTVLEKTTRGCNCGCEPQAGVDVTQQQLQCRGEIPDARSADAFAGSIPHTHLLR